jgi:hypothetical protein
MSTGAMSMVESILDFLWSSGSIPAVITGCFGILAVYLRKFSRENTRQHQESMERREHGHSENMRMRIESRSRLEDIVERIDSIKEDVKEVKQDLNVRIDEVREDVKEVNIDIDDRVDELGQRIDEIREDVIEVRENQQRHIEWHAQQPPQT